jgi:lipopolysaccharide/colanic/teichoic acid biosynthesis glycosyltransferase
MAKSATSIIAFRKLMRGSLYMGIYDAPCFRALINHERCRADRIGKNFTLVAFSFDDASLPPSRIRAISRDLQEAKRTIDEIGWLEGGRIGVLLPATSLEGAHQYARRAVPAEKGISYKVYCYPDHWMSDYSETEGNENEEAELNRPDSFRPAIPPWKRCLDVIGALVILAVLWPLFLLVAAYIKVVSPGPVFFMQKRVGRGGKLFTFIKFRTMKHGNDQGAHQEHIIRRIRAGESLAKLDNLDSRIIPGGKLLRNSCIDELPQLLNVLRGDMSLVGPRPCLPYEAREFLLWHTHRFDALPGMTGLWQVSGKNKLTFAQMIRLDIAYESHLSFLKDMAIIARTVPAIITMVWESLERRVYQERKPGKEISLIEEPMHRQAIL